MAGALGFQMHASDAYACESVLSGDQSFPQAVLDAMAEQAQQAEHEMAELERRRKEIGQEKISITRAIINKRKRDARLSEKCARSLSPEVLMHIAASKVAAKAKAKARSVASGSNSRGDAA